MVVADRQRNARDILRRNGLQGVGRTRLLSLLTSPAVAGASWGNTMRPFLAAGLALLGLILPFAAARADELLTLPTVTSGSYLDSITQTAEFFGIEEVRLGPALSSLELNRRFFFEPDYSSFSKARLDSVQGDVIFRSPDILKWIGSPRPTIGGVVNLGGYESLIHVGLDWHWQIADTPLYAEFGLGAGIHNGYLRAAPPGYRNLGCRTLIHWQYGVGANLNDHTTMTIQWQHMSNYIFGCWPNDGINNASVTLGWKF